jgi:hypothetical protein
MVMLAVERNLHAANGIDCGIRRFEGRGHTSKTRRIQEIKEKDVSVLSSFPRRSALPPSNSESGFMAKILVF